MVFIIVYLLEILRRATLAEQDKASVRAFKTYCPGERQEIEYREQNKDSFHFTFRTFIVMLLFLLSPTKEIPNFTTKNPKVHSVVL